MKKYDARKCNIPLPTAVHKLSALFGATNDADLFVVGGVVRDYMFSLSSGKFDPKDIDLATSENPQKVIEILTSETAQNLGIKCFPKGESFGVISAIVDDEEYEIATFREEWYDPDNGDGRRPDKVKFSTPDKDAARRDLTINALFYDLHSQEVRDYNLREDGVGQGIIDICNGGVIRPVGNARDRFREDKLRILRLVRFACRFHDHVYAYEPEVMAAINEFRDLEGVSG